MDVKISFLNGVIQEEVFTKHPEGFDVENKETHVCRLHRALYGLKKTPQPCYLRINNYLREMEF